MPREMRPWTAAEEAAPAEGTILSYVRSARGTKAARAIDDALRFSGGSGAVSTRAAGAAGVAAARAVRGTSGREDAGQDGGDDSDDEDDDDGDDVDEDGDQACDTERRAGGVGTDGRSRGCAAPGSKRVGGSTAGGGADADSGMVAFRRGGRGAAAVAADSDALDGDEDELTLSLPLHYVDLRKSMYPVTRICAKYVL